MDTYIALDIETTGFNPEKDRVIEFAAIKFTEKGIIDTFQSLVNPGQQIPPLISYMTGIEDNDVAGAPKIGEIGGEITKFIGNCPIVGHNIDFDINFLNQKGFKIKNTLYDTLQLSSILIPGLPSYSLDTLTRTLKIEHVDKHRALSDSKAACGLFLLLLEKIEKIDKSTLDEINEILNKSRWPLKKIFQKSPARKGKKSKKYNTGTKKIENTDKNEKPAGKLDEQHLKEFFLQDGPLSKIIKDYESRPSQIQIVEKILKAFHENHNYLIEAGTGTGKTLAYLLAAIYFATNNNKKIIISTYTKNLQDQIVHKDIPLIKKALNKIDKNLDFKSTLLKGRKNYISLKRLKTMMAKDNYEDHETTFLLKILFWLKETKYGDLEEVNLQGKEFPLKDEICCDEIEDENPDPSELDYHRLAKQKAEKSDLVIVNHALVLNNSVSQSSVLPNYEHIIFDEAHQLERVTTDSLTINFSLNSFAKPYERLIRILNNLEQTKLITNVGMKINHILSRTEIFFGLLGIFIEKYTSPDSYQSQLIIRDDALNSIEWSKVKESAVILNDLNKQILDEILLLVEAVQNENIEVLKGVRDKKIISGDIKNSLFDIEQKTENIFTVFLSGQWANRINWTYKTHEGSGCLKSAPLQIGDALDEFFYEKKKSIIMTSATLRTDHSFQYIRKSLGLDETFEEDSLPSHFSYPDQVKILIPEDLPKPMTEGYFKACTNIIKEIIIKNGGRTLVLFTAKKTLTATYMDIAPGLRKEGFEILAQGISGGKGKILEHFKQEPQSAALFGTDSFWEGVDIPGDLLTCIIMQKLPFDPPSDPIIFSRGQLFSDSFNEYQLPRAILKFKQGFGRLIRTSKDKGSMVILDTRVLQNGYGHQFLESLPEGIKIEYASSRDIPFQL